MKKLQIVYGNESAKNRVAITKSKANGWAGGHIVETEQGFGVEMNSFAYVGNVKIMGIILVDDNLVGKLPPVETNVSAEVTEFIEVSYEDKQYPVDTAPTANVIYRVTKIVVV